MDNKNSEPFCSNCIDKPRVKGIQSFSCIICKQPGMNYSGGVWICGECRTKRNICAICGKTGIEKVNI